MQNDLEVGVLDINSRGEQMESLEQMIHHSELCRSMQELLGHYLQLERYYMQQSVNKAVAMDTIERGSQTSSMVDDVFFIVRKCIRFVLKILSFLIMFYYSSCLSLLKCTILLFGISPSISWGF